MIAQAGRAAVDVLGIVVIFVIAAGTGEGSGIGAPAVVVDIGGRSRNGLLAIITRIAFVTLVVIGAFDRVTARRIELLGRRERLGGTIVIALQHRIFEQVVLDFLLHLDRRKLQELDRLLQLGCQCQMLGEF